MITQGGVKWVRVVYICRLSDESFNFDNLDIYSLRIYICIVTVM